MRQLIVCVVVALSSLVLGGCGSYRVLSEAKTGGTVALHGSHDGAREKAESYMRVQCPSGYEIVEEGDAVSVNNSDREWRIAYVCNGTANKQPTLVAFQ